MRVGIGGRKIQSIEEYLEMIHNGHSDLRSDLICRYKPFILRAVNHICKRPIGWDDDEASIGLIAFNEAIDRYRPDMGKSFDNFAYMVIRTRLIDEFRRAGKIERAETEWHYGDERLSIAETAGSLEAYTQQEVSMTLAEELQCYDQRLQQFGIRLEELEKVTPKHRDTRSTMVKIARMFCTRREWLNILLTKKQLPLKEMVREVDVSKKTLERNRKYIISLILIFGCEEFSSIRQTVSFARLEED
ncbi:RNA polymerase sigma factor SigI [Insulibacter thermoxylanivorax]|uniref:RNA polymerase sigma factor SigI n=2 Tax=Insulibacter thermoxylanivorax TaxID=2749268 RepID=A0A916QC90_9BACL|nr:RNA polymerase sigma factor SigI [Insulibacter thermoxylanivorax]